MGAFDGWYTDLVDVYRIQTTKVGAVSSTARVPVETAVPCRVYSTPASSPSMQDTAARSYRANKLALPIGVDIKAGDELLVTRGGALGHTGTPVRYIAGAPQLFLDPVGGILTGLDHQEVGLLEDNIIQ